MIENTIQKQIKIINECLEWFTLSLHKEKWKWKLMIIDNATKLYTPLIIDKMSVIQKWLWNVIMHSQNEWYNIYNLLLYLRKQQNESL